MITGSGGSGTRVVAQILRDGGVFMGADLNESLDDQVFNFLFKHPTVWGASPERSAAARATLSRHFDLHRRLFFGGKLEGRADWSFWLAAGWRHTWKRYNALWTLRRYRHLGWQGERETDRWGFKEPHLLFFLRELREAHPDARLVLLLRNGLDMAFSKNDQQFEFWSRGYGIDSRDRSPRNRFEFWYRTNRRAIDQGSEHFGARFHVIRFEDLCESPREQIEALFDFAQIPKGRLTDEILSVARTPPTVGRFRQHDLGWIDETVSENSSTIGYQVEVPASKSGRRDGR